MGSRSSQILGSAVLAAAAVLGGCASQGAVLRSNHYQLVVPARWQATEEGGVAVLHIPQAENAPGGGGLLELRVHAWLVDRTVEQPVEESLRLLAKKGTALREPASDEDDEACGERPHGFRLFGQARFAAHMRTPSGDYVVVTAAQSSASLIAAVGIVPNRAPLCDNLSVMTRAMQSLHDTLTPADDPTVAVQPPLVVDSPIPGRPPIEVPPPKPLP